MTEAATVKSISMVTQMDGTPVLMISIDRREAPLIKRRIDKVNDLLANGKPVEVSIERRRERRSLDANAYMWVLCDKIAAVISSTAEQVYRECLRDYGRTELRPVRNDSLDAVCDHWSKIGKGFMADVWTPSSEKGYTNVLFYYGSHTYDTLEMARLIDGIVFQASALGIETKTPEEIDRLKTLWRDT